MTDNEQKCMKKKKWRISLSLLGCYLIILLTPSVSTIVIYNMAKTAMTDNQEERIEHALSLAATGFSKEIEMAQNVGYYVSREKRLVNYLSNLRDGKTAGQFYEQYLVASNYPNYSLTNQIIKNVYILIADSDYVIRIPQVLPINGENTAALVGFPLYSYEAFQEFYETQDQNSTLLYYEENGTGALLLHCQMVYPGIQDNKCAIVVELNMDEICDLISPVLDGEEGLVALVDENGTILEKYQSDETGVSRVSGKSDTVEELQASLGWKDALTVSEDCGYNNWKIVTVVPKAVLSGRMGPARYISVAVCVTAILIGILICLTYWYRRKNILHDYVLLRQRMNGSNDEGTGFWKGLEGFLDEVNNLHNKVEKQEALLQTTFLRKLLYGNYESQEEILEAASKVHICLDDNSYCVVNIELDDPAQLEHAGFPEKAILLDMAEQLIRECLPWKLWIYHKSELSSVLVLHEKEEIDREQLKIELENLSFEFYGRLQLQGFVGVSCTVREPAEIARQYEISSRVCEFSRYKGIRFPVFPEDLPGEKIREPIFFTIDMEMKAVSLLRSGNMDQIEEMIARIRTMYLYQGMDPQIYRHMVETLRGCVFRSIPGENEGEQDGRLSAAAAKAGNAEEIFVVMRNVGSFWAERTKEREKIQISIDKDEMVAYIEEHYGNPDFNLAMVAEWAGESERKLYNAFKSIFGISFSSYLEQLRLAHACELLKQGAAVKDIADQVGYCSDYSFRRAFKRIIGVSPSDYRKCQTV